MKRSPEDSRERYSLIPVKQLQRVALHYTKGAEKYGQDNWKEATRDNLPRALDSLLRHTYQLVSGETSEDHMAAIVFNAFLIDYIRNNDRVRDRVAYEGINKQDLRRTTLDTEKEDS